MASADPASRTLVGAVLSRRWRLVQRLGEGGMGEVYAADPLETGPRVAVKILRPEYLGEPSVLSRFLEEATTCMRLIHPNIVRMLECASAEDGSPYLVMELLEGVPLGAYTQNGGRVPMAQAVPILQGILAGLAAAHAQGIVHRDLKPDNVFLTRASDGTFVVKVLDFGIAKVMDAAGGMGSRTRTGMLLGTPAYMSPEQIKNARDVDQRADLWSAGVMFYEMLTGRVAFPAPTEYARLAAVLSSEPESLERIDASLAVLAPFLAVALRKNRDERFPSALEMARALALAAPHLAQRSDGSVGKITAAAALPLSRLPDVPSVFTPSLLSPAVSHEPHTYPGSSGVPVTAAAEPMRAPARAPGGTLASPAGSQPPIADPAPYVMMVAAQTLGETLPSNDLPIIARGHPVATQGVPPWVVVILVMGALIAGFLLGWAFARMT
ncbi:MAG TPA: serine/threonine-protein kinase [Polyangiaceae bacterium]|nr:serine/threonine-protein kinase [Polyangiaceae bacterium]